MLAKLTTKNQLTLPKKALDAVGHPSYFTIDVEDGRLILSPAHPGGADSVRRKLASLGIDDQDVADAVAWARRAPGGA